MTQVKRVKRDIDGLLFLDKPSGISSNRALQIAKRLFKARKAGHTGSLDPLASGMLPLCFGNATKVSALMLASDKAYEVRMKIGERTDTADAEGEVVERSVVTELTDAQLAEAISAYTGEYDQVPPMYSALKKDGQRLYKLAREGIEVERKARRITIHEVNVIDADPAQPKLFVRCSKGTYIRSLVEDIAAAAGTLAHVIELRRVWVEPFRDVEMITLPELEALAEEGEGDDCEALDGLLAAPDIALKHLPEAHFTAEDAARLANGQAAVPQQAVSGTCRMYAENGDFIGIGEASDGENVAPKRIFARNL